MECPNCQFLLTKVDDGVFACFGCGESFTIEELYGDPDSDPERSGLTYYAFAEDFADLDVIPDDDNE